jgi:hypothetical protein|tara:strand:+ start:2042 stop:2632 length:591 start_codon:yes stop_codon:yes gene_type:complete
MADPFESYKLYNSLKLHFETDGYDAFKYNFKSNVKSSSFLKRKDKYFFAKVARHYEKDMMGYYVANFKQGVSYVGEMINEVGEDNYKNHKRIIESIHRVFSVDINILNEQNLAFDELFESVEGQHPLVIQLWMQEEISLETVVILNSILGFVPRESVKITDTLMWPDVKKRIIKYTPFVNFDVNKCKILLQKGFTK